MVDFDLKTGKLSDLLLNRGISSFQEACAFVQNLPYERISDKSNLTLIVTENRGTCSSKHAFLAELAGENNIESVELICGIFLMSPETHPSLAPFFQNKNYEVIPEAHCYLRIHNQRIDFTSSKNRMESIAPKLVREQRIEPHQANEWKELTHKDYIRKYIARNPALELNFDDFWQDRESCISILSKSY